MKLSKVEAAYLILKREKKAMTYKDITDISIKEKLIVTKGKTPDATLRVDIFKENNRKLGRGESLRFNIETPGYVSLY